MLIVTNYAGTRTEGFFTTSAPLFEQDTLGNTTLEFTVNKTNNEVGFNLLQEESIVTAANYDFRVKQIIDDKPGRKTILAISTFFDLAYQFKDKTYGGTHSSQEFVNYLFAGTGWTVTCDFTETATIDKFGSKNIIQCVNQVCDAFNCEFEILPNKRVHFSKSLGPDNGAQYRYGHNIKTLSRKIDTTHLRTKVTATGKEGLTVTYTSPNHTIWGIRVADPISDERFTNPDNLLKKAKDSLIDYPEVSIELDTLELLDKALGEKVWLIYEPIEGLELQTRILKRTCVIDEITDELKTIEVTLGNSLPRSMSDSELDSEEELADTKEELEEVIDESKKEFRSAITQTDSRITIEVEQLNKSIAKIDVKADSIDLSVNNRITNEVAAINIRADQIQSTVSSQGSQLHGMDTRVANAESTITQQAHQITQKVSVTDYNGDTIVSKINQDAWSYTIDAQRINLNGAVMVNGSISGSTDINVSRDVWIGRNLTFQSSGQNVIRFADMTTITSDGGGGLAIDLWNELDIQSSKTTFYGNVAFNYGTVDFSNANVVGLNNGGGISLFQSTNNPKTLVVRKNGSDIGYIDLK
ncbi:phage tail protein [Lysinibacillus xylanilyticus]|uniref:phage tail spike protein n=1 Tax=Lysinibacillus xylanilyticus TaxID=582475 RepID=UPI002B24919D|nr:phage tail spike protein [Lysinibacillus xylanilyticus]MEB2279657.1 phage tail protein [Lysinibacillus xylanilyticus]